jgi:hypothetical protein
MKIPNNSPWGSSMLLRTRDSSSVSRGSSGGGGRVKVSSMRVNA